MDKQGLDERSTENNILQLMDQTYVTSSTEKNILQWISNA